MKTGLTEPRPCTQGRGERKPLSEFAPPFWQEGIMRSLAKYSRFQKGGAH